MKFYREFFNNTELNYKESLALCIMLDKKGESFKFDTKEFCTLLDCGKTTCFSILKTLKNKGYISKKGKTTTVCVEKLNNLKSYIYISSELLKDKDLLPIDKIIYSGLKSLLGYNNTDELGVPCVYCSIDTIASKIKCCRDNVFASIKRLEERKLIVKFKISSSQNRYYISEYKCNKRAVDIPNKTVQEKVQNTNMETAHLVQNTDTIINTNYYYIKENKEKSERVSRHLQKTLSQDKINFYLKFIDRFTDKLNAKKYPLTRKLVRLIDEFFEFYNFNQLDIILDKILNTDYLSTGNGKWVKNIYHFLQNDVFIKIFSGFYDKFKSAVNNVKIKNKFNDFKQRTYSEEFYDSLYANNDTKPVDANLVVPLSY